ncbi:MAG TPA: PH domain-containing protein [Actinomycetes bacterium]|nr:PH domain-containing protein [Actinomycetes bacterium]
MQSEPRGPAPGLVEPGRPRRLHPLTPVFLAVREGRRLWPLALLALAQRRLWLIALAALVVLVATVLQWLRRSYVVEADALRVEQGVFARQLRVVPFDRIQQVDLVRKPLHRLLGVATLRVETAGGASASEVDLDVIALAEAESLRAALLRARAATTGEAPGTRPPRGTKGEAPGSTKDQAPRSAEGGAPGGAEGGAASGAGVPLPGTVGPAEVAGRPLERDLVRLSLGEVALAGITSARAAAVLAVLSPVFQLLDQAPGWVLDRVDPEALAPSSPLVVAALVPLAVLVWLGLAAASSIVTHAGFVLARSDDNLVVRRGLLERREAVVPLVRVQVVRIEESLLRRGLGFASVRIQSAGAAGRSDDRASRLAVPILRADRVNQVLGELLPGAAPVPLLLAPPPTARRRAIVRRVVPALVAAVAVAVVLRPWGLLALAAVPLAALAGEAAYRNLGHARRAGFLTARQGALLRTTTVIPVAKAQSARVHASLFQRRAGLATLYVDVAGGGTMPKVTDESGATAEALLASVVSR